MRRGKDMNEDLEIMIDTKNGEWIDLGLPNSEPVSYTHLTLPTILLV